MFSTRIRHSRTSPIPDILQAMGLAPRTSIMADTETEIEDHNDDDEVMDGPDESLPSEDVKPLARIQELEVMFRFDDISPSSSFSSCSWNFSACVHK